MNFGTLDKNQKIAVFGVIVSIVGVLVAIIAIPSVGNMISNIFPPSLPAGADEALRNYLTRDYVGGANFQYRITSAQKASNIRPTLARDGRITSMDEMWCITTEPATRPYGYSIEKNYILYRIGSLWSITSTIGGGPGGANRSEFLSLGCENYSNEGDDSDNY